MEDEQEDEQDGSFCWAPPLWTCYDSRERPSPAASLTWSLTRSTSWEVDPSDYDALWVRGGFPDSFLAGNDGQSLTWRENFVRTYLERDVPQFGSRIPAETLRRFWVMMAHTQGGLFNTAALARGLGVGGKTISRYLDLMVDLLLVRRLMPWHRNVGKRLVRSPKVYVRDSGIVHALLGLGAKEEILGHPIVGLSWRGL